MSKLDGSDDKVVNTGGDGVRDLSGINLSAPSSLPSSTNDGPGASPEGTSFPTLPAAPPSRVVGQGYSSAHPVPTVQAYKEEQKQHQVEADQYAEIVAKRQAEAEERMRKANAVHDQATAAPVAAADPAEGDKEKKANANKTKDPISSKPVNEKQRMMEQMNSNQRTSSRLIGMALVTCLDASVDIG